MTDEAPARRRRIGPRTTVAAIIALVALVYVAVIALYAFSGKVELTKEGPDDTQVRLPIELNIESVDPVAGRLKVNLDLRPTGALDATGGAGLILAQPVTLIATDVDGPRALDFPASTPLSPVEVRLLTDGDVQFWPFDTYEVDSRVLALTSDNADHIALDWSVGRHRVPGWTFDVHVTELEGGKVYGVTILAQRAGATVAFGIVLLGLMVVMPVIVLTVAINVYRGKQKMEATLMSWIGAMLFATIPLRGFLPGSPPIGSWIDYLVVLWVIAGLIAGSSSTSSPSCGGLGRSRPPRRRPPAEPAAREGPPPAA